MWRSLKVTDVSIRIQSSWPHICHPLKLPVNKNTHEMFCFMRHSHYLCSEFILHTGNANHKHATTTNVRQSLCIMVFHCYKINKMIRLNLPTFQIKLSGTKQKPTIYDILRRKHVALTPEEWVRQHFIHYLIEHKSYPQSLMANEVSLKYGAKALRADTVLYNRELKPIMIMEYKAPDIAITRNVFDQISAYNILLHVDYLVMSNGLQHYCCKMNYEQRNYTFLEDIPDYPDII